MDYDVNSLRMRNSRVSRGLETLQRTQPGQSLRPAPQLYKHKEDLAFNDSFRAPYYQFIKDEKPTDDKDLETLQRVQQEKFSVNKVNN